MALTNNGKGKKKQVSFISPPAPPAPVQQQPEASTSRHQANTAERQPEVAVPGIAAQQSQTAGFYNVPPANQTGYSPGIDQFSDFAAFFNDLTSNNDTSFQALNPLASRNQLLNPFHPQTYSPLPNEGSSSGFKYFQQPAAIQFHGKYTPINPELVGSQQPTPTGYTPGTFGVDNFNTMHTYLSAHADILSRPSSTATPPPQTPNVMDTDVNDSGVSSNAQSIPWNEWVQTHTDWNQIIASGIPDAMMTDLADQKTPDVASSTTVRNDRPLSAPIPSSEASQLATSFTLPPGLPEWPRVFKRKRSDSPQMPEKDKGKRRADGDVFPVPNAGQLLADDGRALIPDSQHLPEVKIEQIDDKTPTQTGERVYVQPKELRDTQQRSRDRIMAGNLALKQAIDIEGKTPEEFLDTKKAAAKLEIDGVIDPESKKHVKDSWTKKKKESTMKNVDVSYYAAAYIKKVEEEKESLQTDKKRLTESNKSSEKDKAQLTVDNAQLTAENAQLTAENQELKRQNALFAEHFRRLKLGSTVRQAPQAVPVPKEVNISVTRDNGVMPPPAYNPGGNVGFR